MQEKSQTAIEFTVLVGVILFFFAVFFLAIQESAADTVKEKQNLLVRETAFAIQDEINLASESSNGYSRDFKIPEKLGSQDYDVSLADGTVYVRTSDNKSAVALPAPPVTGNLAKGVNTIKKINDIIYLN